MSSLFRSGTSTLVGRALNVPKCNSMFWRHSLSLHARRPLSPRATFHASAAQRFSQRAFQAPCLVGLQRSTNLAHSREANMEIWPRIIRFSNSAALCIRNTYFPRSPPGRKSPKKDGPFSKFSRTVNSIPSGVVLWTVLGLNGVVYLLWNIAIDGAQNHRDVSILTFLVKNFTLSWQNWKEGRFWTVLTSCFSNQATSHIFMNALTFYFMAPPVLQILGNASFLTLYLGGGIASSLITLFFNEHLLRQPRVVHGASGAIYAVISFMASTAPKATFLIFGIIPVPAWGCVAGLFTWDLLNAVSQRQTGVSEISHLSGIICGIVYFLYKTGRLPRVF